MSSLNYLEDREIAETVDITKDRVSQTCGESALKKKKTMLSTGNVMITRLGNFGVMKRLWPPLRPTFLRSSENIFFGRGG